MREMYCGYALWRILYSEIGDYERKKRKLQWVCCRLYPFICWIIIKEGPGNFSGGRSPHWVNHVNLCLYCIVYLMCFVSKDCICFILLLHGPVFLTFKLPLKFH
jgi:hypothetical protein